MGHNSLPAPRLMSLYIASPRMSSRTKVLSDLQFEELREPTLQHQKKSKTVCVLNPNFSPETLLPPPPAASSSFPARPFVSDTCLRPAGTSSLSPCRPVSLAAAGCAAGWPWGGAGAPSRRPPRPPPLRSSACPRNWTWTACRSTGPRYEPSAKS